MSEIMLPKEMSSRVRRAYEVGRIRAALGQSTLMTVVVMIVAGFAEGPTALRWAPITFAAWMLLAWRGGALLEGGRWGVLAGIVTFLLPMSILRPCCKPGMDMAAMGPDCCTRPELCILSGAVVGLLLAVSLPMKTEKRLSRAAGAMIGVLAVTSLRCAALFYGETLGLLGGIAVGVIATSAARHFWYARTHGNSR